MLNADLSVMTVSTEIQFIISTPLPPITQDYGENLVYHNKDE